MSKVAVIGAGPAGIAAAIQLTRTGIEIKIYEQHRVGGTLLNAGWVENYPGFPGGITGRHLVRLMEQQLFEYVDSLEKLAVDKIEKIDTGYTVDGEKFDGVIICTGTKSKPAGFSGEKELAEAGKLHYSIEYLEHWHGAKEIGIIGGGEASMDMALSLFEAGMKVTLIHRSEPTGIKSLMETARNEEGIAWIQGNVSNGRVHEEKAVLALENEELAFDLIVVAVGREKALPELVRFDIGSLPEGCFVAGDAARGSLGQATMAVGDGVEMAMKMMRFLEAGK